MQNVTADWHQYNMKCGRHGTNYHASEGGCGICIDETMIADESVCPKCHTPKVSVEKNEDELWLACSDCGNESDETKELAELEGLWTP